MNRKKLTSLLLILMLGFLGACGSFEKEKEKLLSSPDQEKDLAKVFDLNKEQAELFKEQPKEEAKPEIEASAKGVKGKKTKGKKASKKTAGKEADKEKYVTPAEAVKAQSGFGYPADYPQILKDYDVHSEKVWEKFRPVFYKGEQSIMAISYLGVTAGYVTIESKDIVKISDKMAFNYYARFKSKDAYRYFYWLDDKIETFLDNQTFLPVKYSLIQREKKQDVDDLQLFDFKKLKTYHWFKKVKNGAVKEEKMEKYIPRFAQDSFSALMFVRGLPMHKGAKYDFPVLTRGKVWLLKVEVMGEENITVNSKEVKAYKLQAETHFPGVLQKSGDINFWYAADETRRLLKFQAKIKIGSIFGELVEYKPGTLIK